MKRISSYSHTLTGSDSSRASATATKPTHTSGERQKGAAGMRPSARKTLRDKCRGLYSPRMKRRVALAILRRAYAGAQAGARLHVLGRFVSCPIRSEERRV